jgi:hypothetical protein
MTEANNMLLSSPTPLLLRQPEQLASKYLGNGWFWRQIDSMIEGKKAIISYFALGFQSIF